MQSNIFIPKKLNVGFQNRSDTYTQKLAYVIYYDQTGKLRKETSWNSWRDDKIEPILLENEPTSGFVINKKAGGYDTGWNHRNTYVRIYDPRDFEFEISVANLLYILENTNSIKGKGLEGEFVYGWEGTELILIPVESPDYKKMEEFSSILQEQRHIKGKDLKIGATYKTKSNDSWVYMGRFDKYNYYKTNVKKHYWFYDSGKKYNLFYPIKSLGNKIISLEREECIENYADIFEKLEKHSEYSPIDDDKVEYIPYSFDEVCKKLETTNWFYCYFQNGTRIEIQKIWNAEGFRVLDQENWVYGNHNVYHEGSLKEVFEHAKPCYKREYLANGKIYSESK